MMDVKFLLLTCSLLQKLNHRISRRGQFQRLFVRVCGRQNNSCLPPLTFVYKCCKAFRFRRRATLTFGGDHQLTGQSQRSHGVLVNQSGKTTCRHKAQSNRIRSERSARQTEPRTHQSRAHWDNPSAGRLWRSSQSGSVSPAR